MHLKKIAVFLLLLALLPTRAARAEARPQAAAQTAGAHIVSYQMEVTLAADQRQLSGTQTITYRNQTDTPISDLVFHLYLNAFRDENSLFMQEGGGAHRGNAFSPADSGWIEVDDLRVAGGPALALEALDDGTLARASLPAAVAPGESITLETEFHAQLPRVFARTGWALDAAGQPFFMVGQWFPKLGVWQGQRGWNAYPFHANSEFFADFGAYDVTIHLPAGYTTGATGMPAEASAAPASSADGMQTVRYRADNVIDFAWTASPSLQVAARTISLPAGDIEINYLYLPEHAWTVERTLAVTAHAMARYSQWFGPYPYPRLTVVDVPEAGQGAGGMEYPTLITAGAMNIFGLPTFSSSGWERSLEVVVAHEVGHQWWMGLVAFNEAEEPWLDEGITDYATVRLMDSVYGSEGSVLDLGRLRASYLDLRRGEYLSNPTVPMYGKAWEFTSSDYGVAAYAKPALSLLTLEGVLGEDLMLQVMSTFFERYRFGHPTTEDFRQTAEEVSGQDLAWFFDGLVYGQETLNYRAQAINGRTFTVEREGQLIAPTEIELTFEGGASRVMAWDGRETPKTFSFPNDPPLLKAEIDPQRKLVIDMIWSDNGLRVTPDVSSWLALFSGLVFSLQDVLLMLGGL